MTPHLDDGRIREIETGTVPDRFARGWHCVGLSESFKGGKPHAIQAFGTKLVVFADSEGDVQALDAYCRHMGWRPEQERDQGRLGRAGSSAASNARPHGRWHRAQAPSDPLKKSRAPNRSEKAPKNSDR